MSRLAVGVLFPFALPALCLLACGNGATLAPIPIYEASVDEGGSVFTADGYTVGFDAGSDAPAVIPDAGHDAVSPIDAAHDATASDAPASDAPASDAPASDGPASDGKSD